jgi:hypothetical protein
MARQMSENEWWANRRAKKDDHLLSLSGMTGWKDLGIGSRIPGMRGAGIGGRRLRTPARAFVASSSASKGSPESGGERKGIGG